MIVKDYIPTLLFMESPSFIVLVPNDRKLFGFQVFVGISIHRMSYFSFFLLIYVSVILSKHTFHIRPLPDAYLKLYLFKLLFEFLLNTFYYDQFSYFWQVFMEYQTS